MSTPAPAARLGPYELIERIGKGGMGEVWRARDPRLGREVAVKVSAQQFTDRFEREARSIAALNHPNICTLHDVGPNYLVMELIEGPTLAERIAEGPIPVEESLAIAKQIAAALEAAHEKGIIHRDLKPANIKVRSDGSVKVLDFGLAKPAIESGELTPDSPTMLSAVGMIVGTAAYMAPEQARGKNVDKRADIWAFGVVLYEMFAGKKLFTGETITDVLAAVVTKDPDLSAVPANARRLLLACLEKDPRLRLRDIGDMGRLLNDPAAETTRRRSRFSSIGWIAAVALPTIIAALLAVLHFRGNTPVDLPLLRFDFDLGDDVSMAPPQTGGSSIAISSDATRIAYIAGKPARVFTRRLDQPKAIELAGTDGADKLTFSPDGNSIAFTTHGDLNRIGVEGGPAATLIRSMPNIAGFNWSADGTILLGRAFPGRLARVQASGGQPEVIVESPLEVALVHPQKLPGDHGVLFASARSLSENAIEVLTLPDRRRKIVGPGGGSTPRYLPTSARMGHLIYTKKAILFAVPFDLGKLQIRGTPVPVLDDVASSVPSGVAQFDFSAAPPGHGTLIYRRAMGAADSAAIVQWTDSTGRTEPCWPNPAPMMRSR